MQMKISCVVAWELLISSGAKPSARRFSDAYAGLTALPFAER